MRRLVVKRSMSMMKKKDPVVGVMCCFSESQDQILTHNERHAVANKYLEPLTNQRCVPVLIPASSAFDIDTMLNRLDGIVFPGSPSNIHPSAYDREETDRHPFDRKNAWLCLDSTH